VISNPVSSITASQAGNKSDKIVRKSPTHDSISIVINCYCNHINANTNLTDHKSRRVGRMSLVRSFQGSDNFRDAKTRDIF